MFTECGTFGDFSGPGLPRAWKDDIPIQYQHLLDTSLSKFPWLAWVHPGQNSPASCRATIIADEWVVTSWDCAKEFNS